MMMKTARQILSDDDDDLEPPWSYVARPPSIINLLLRSHLTESHFYKRI